MASRADAVAGTVLAALLMAAGAAGAQTGPLTEAECRALRDRLAEHARLSDGVRRALAAQAARYPPPLTPPPPGSLPAPAHGGSRAAAIRARLAQIPGEMRRLEDERLGAMLRLQFARASEIQMQLQALETERADLERELAGLPAGPPPPAPASRAAGPPAPPAPLPDAERIPCWEIAAANESAVRTRQRELGAREGQAGALPLLALKGQTPDQIARELAGQFAAWPQAGSQVGLLDQDGDGRLDGFADAPLPHLFRLYRHRADGTLGVEVFAVPGAYPAPAYDEMVRRLEEATLRQIRRGATDLLASRPAGPVRVLAEAGEFARAQGAFVAGNFAEAGRIEGGGARAVEFQNFRGEAVRALEVIAPAAGGVAYRRLVVLPAPNNEEQWEETAIRLRPSSYWRLEAEVTVTAERRGAGGVIVASRSLSGPFRFAVDR